MDQVIRVGTGVHALALLSLPVAFFGAVILSQRLEALGALIAYGFGAVAIMNAAVFDGLLVPKIAVRMSDSDTWRILFLYNGMLNQAFALVYVVASSAAIVLWSFAMRREAKVLGVVGMILGPLITIPVLTHLIGLDAHGFGMIVLVEGAWFIASGIWLVRLKS